MQFVRKIISRLQEDNGPAVQLFYVAIGPVAYLLYAYKIYYSRFDHVGALNVAVGNLAALLAFYYYIKAARTDPGTITASNHLHHHSKYRAYIDHCIFIEDNKCETCGFMK